MSAVTPSAGARVLRVPRAPGSSVLHAGLARRGVAGLALALVISLAGPLPAASPAARAETPDRPNIVVFYLDDVSPHDGRLWNDRARTPAIYDNFVAQGTEFSNAIGETPLCCPGRVSLLTGLHTHNHGVFANSATLFAPQEHVGAALLRAGYASMFIGKYLNQNNYLTAEGWAAHQAGWTHHDVIWGWNGDFYDYTVRTKEGDVAYPTLHSTEMVAERAIERLRQTAPETPVFAILSVYNLHLSNEPMPAFAADERCNEIAPWNPPNYNEADVSDKPAYIQSLPLLPYPDGWPMDVYCREMLGVDWLVDSVVDELATQGRLENTLLVFTADNGVTWGAHRRGQKKTTPYSTRVPLYMSWPSRWGTERQVMDEHTSNIDLAPTFCEIAGCVLGPYPTGQPAADGVSLLPLLDGRDAAGNSVTTLGRDALLEQTNGWRAVRTTAQSSLGLWHYVEHSTGERELYDLSGGPCHEWQEGMPGDPCELTNVASDPALAELQAQLSARLGELLAEGRRSRIDASIALVPEGPYKGELLYSTVPAPEQTQRRRRVLRGATYDYPVKVVSPGAAFVVRGSQNGSGRMKVSYLLDGVDVTSSVNSTDGLLVEAGPDTTTALVIRIRVGPRARLSAVMRSILTMTTGTDGEGIDVVRAIATRR